MLERICLRTLFTMLVLSLTVIASAQWSTNGNAVYYNSGNVGLGTSTPGQKLDVLGNTRFSGPSGSWALGTAHTIFISADGSPVGFQNTSSVAGSGAHMYDNNGALKAYFQWNNSGVGVSPSSLVFGALNPDPIVFDTNLVERMRISGTGNIGIATASPSSTLDVNGTAHVSGDLTVDGNIAALYQDVAEWVPASTPLSPGTVVVLDRRHTNVVTTSTMAYDTAVAGVVSSQPGIVLGRRSGANAAQVATTGRVRVHADAGAAAIGVGDLLVTGTKPGTAMKSEPVIVNGLPFHRPGTIIGKALEPLASGEGEILVLLSLQ